MQIILLILQLITLAALCYVIHQNNQLKKQLDSIKESYDELYAMELSYYKKNYGNGTYAVIKEWFDTHDCTAEYVEADNLSDAFLKCEPIDEDNGTIINIFKVD